jgi:hypothetical protein
MVARLGSNPSEIPKETPKETMSGPYASPYPSATPLPPTGTKPGINTVSFKPINRGKLCVRRNSEKKKKVLKMIKKPTPNQ